MGYWIGKCRYTTLRSALYVYDYKPCFFFIITLSLSLLLQNNSKCTYYTNWAKTEEERF